MKLLAALVAAAGLLAGSSVAMAKELQQQKGSMQPLKVLTDQEPEGNEPKSLAAPDPARLVNAQPEAMWDDKAATGKQPTYVDPLIRGETDLVWEARQRLPPGLGSAVQLPDNRDCGCDASKNQCPCARQLVEAELKPEAPPAACPCEQQQAGSDCSCGQKPAPGGVEVDLKSDMEYVHPELKSSSSSSSCACAGEVDCDCEDVPRQQVATYADEPEPQQTPAKFPAQQPPTEQTQLLRQRQFEGPARLPATQAEANIEAERLAFAANMAGGVQPAASLAGGPGADALPAAARRVYDALIDGARQA